MVLLSDKHPIDLTIGQELPPTFHYAWVILLFETHRVSANRAQTPSYRKGGHKTGLVLNRVRTRFVNGDRTSVYLGLVGVSNCLSGLGVGCHLDKRTVWLPHAVVRYDVGRLDRADRGEELTDLGFIRRDGSVANLELSTH